MAGVFETVGILLVIVAFSVGQVVVVSPIVATSPLWILGEPGFFFAHRKFDFAHSFRAVCVVARTIAISVVH